MNILILETGEVEQKIIDLCLKSRYIEHIYTASKQPLEKISNIEYFDYEDLYKKARALLVDVVLVFDKNLIREGVVDFLKKKKLNTISVNQKWFNLEESRLVAKQLLNYYSINYSEVIRVPLTFPVVLKSNNTELVKIVGSMSELLELKKIYSEKKIFLEQYLEGEVKYLLFIWDGKNLLILNSEIATTEVQLDRLDLLHTKMKFMFSEENPNFIGFFTVKIIWSKNDWYILDFIMRVNEKSDLDFVKPDFVYLLNSAIYQKLNEIEI